MKNKSLSQKVTAMLSASLLAFAMLASFSAAAKEPAETSAKSGGISPSALWCQYYYCDSNVGGRP